MGVSINTRKVYSEVDEFLELLDDDQRNKIPRKLREFFKEEKDQEYKKGIDPNIAIKDQDLKEETLAIIAFLNLQYWCEDENEKNRLKKVYAKNEQVYQEMLQIAFNPDDIFKKRKKEENQEERTQIIEYKDSIFRRIINKILNIFHKKL